MRNFLLILCAAALLTAGGCAGKQESSSRIYHGDAPTIRYGGEEAAGGVLRER